MNRCGLENPTKITYDWTEDHQVYFKFFFDSLYLPKDLQVNEPDIQNTFLRKDVYEFKDEFQILEVNKKEGYVKVLPDDQHFKVIRNYKDAKEIHKDEESVYLNASNRLSEAFISNNNLILQESEEEDTSAKNPVDAEVAKVEGGMPDADTRENTKDYKQKVAADKEKKEKEEAASKPSGNLDVFSYFNPLSNSFDTENVLQQIVDKMQGNADEGKGIDYVIFEEFFGNNDDYPQSKLIAYNLIFKGIESKLKGKDSSNFLGITVKNNNANGILEGNTDKIKVINDYSDGRAQEIIKLANIKDLNLDQVETPGDVGSFTDTTKNSFESALGIAKKIVERYVDQVRERGGVFKLKNTDKKNEKQAEKFYAALRDLSSNKAAAKALAFCFDVYGGESQDAADKEFYRAVKDKTLFTIKRLRFEQKMSKHIDYSKGDLLSLVSKELEKASEGWKVAQQANDIHDEGDAHGGFTFGGKNVSLKRTTADKNKDEKPGKDRKRQSRFPVDFYAFIANQADFKSLYDLFNADGEWTIDDVVGKIPDSVEDDAESKDKDKEGEKDSKKKDPSNSKGEKGDSQNNSQDNNSSASEGETGSENSESSESTGDA